MNKKRAIACWYCYGLVWLDLVGVSGEVVHYLGACDECRIIYDFRSRPKRI